MRLARPLTQEERRLAIVGMLRLQNRPTAVRPALHLAEQYVARCIEKIKDVPMLLNLHSRRDLLAKARDNLGVQGEELDRCRASFDYWLEWYGWTYDPRLPQRMLPFIPYEFQREATEWVATIRAAKTEGIVEKARDMGATWLFVAYFTWCWLFEDGFAGLFCSRKVTLVDSKGDPSSIMQKARLMIRGLPAWMTPKDYSEDKHALKLRIINPANGSILTGEGGNQIGRGGRSSMVLIDEAAFTPKPDSVEAALSETSEVKFWLSTPNTPGDWFSTKRFSGVFAVLSLRWRRDPRKNAWQAIDGEGQVVATGAGEAPDPKSLGARKIIWPWYEKAKQRYTDPAKLAREVDIDYSASSDRVVFPAAWVRAATNLDLGDMGTIVECGGDLAGDGADSDIWTMRRGGSVVVQKTITRPNPTTTARAFLMVTESVDARILHYDAGGGYGGALKGEHDAGTNGGRVWPFELHAVNGGGKCSARKFGDKPAKELFINLRAEMYWTVRERFRKAYELALWRQGEPAGIPHEPDECISIPDDPELTAQLCSVLLVEIPSGKVQMESKKAMKGRGVKSPDKADSLVYSFAPTPNPLAMHVARTTTVAG